MSRTLRPADHGEREVIASRLVGDIIAEHGENVVAIAVQGSFAREDDGPFSDLELVAFVKRQVQPRAWVRIIDGLYVEVSFLTKEEYEHRLAGEDWYIAGSDTLRFLYGDPFESRPVPDLGMLTFAAWTNVREETGKVLNAVESKNARNLPFSLAMLQWHVLRLLALVNERPYVRSAHMVDEALALEHIPDGFAQFVALFERGEFKGRTVAEVTMRLLRGVEAMCEELGIPSQGDI